MKLKKIILSSGQELEITQGVTAIVGPNNSGKSTLLHDLNDLLNKSPATQFVNTKVAASYEIDFGPMSKASARAWMSRYVTPLNTTNQDPQGNPIDESFFETPSEGVFRLSDFDVSWGSQSGLGALSNWFVKSVSAEGHSGFIEPAPTFAASSSKAPSVPIQALYAQPELEKPLQKLIKRTFNVDITLDHSGGGTTEFRLGRPQFDYGRDGLSKYGKEMAGFPLLSAQGDGLKAFSGIAVLALSQKTPLILIDEPETFLHPPQARRLGQFFASRQFSGTQIIIATHSRDIIDGLVSTSRVDSEVAIHRITQLKGITGNPNVNRAASLTAKSLKTVNEDPLLHYSGLLSGLFSNGTLLCEGDSDCTYFRAVFDRMKVSAELDLHFVNCNGIHAIPKAFATFRKDRVPVAAVVDIDLLNKKSVLKKFVEAAGGDISDFEPLRKQIADEVDGISAAPVLKTSVKTLVDSLVADTTSTQLDDAGRRLLQAIIRAPKGWDSLKKYGVEYIQPNGSYVLSTPRKRDFKLLNDRLRNIGVFMLTVGELEGFHPSVTGKKGKWTEYVLSQGLFRSDAKKAQRLLQDVASCINQLEREI